MLRLAGFTGMTHSETEKKALAKRSYLKASATDQDHDDRYDSDDREPAPAPFLHRDIADAVVRRLCGLISHLSSPRRPT